MWTVAWTGLVRERKRCKGREETGLGMGHEQAQQGEKEKKKKRENKGKKEIGHGRLGSCLTSSFSSLFWSNSVFEPIISFFLMFSSNSCKINKHILKF